MYRFSGLSIFNYLYSHIQMYMATYSHINLDIQIVKFIYSHHDSIYRYSRVGMVFLEPKNLGWKPLVTMYLKSERLSRVLHPECISLVDLWLEWLIPPLLFFLTRDCVMPVVIDELQLVTSLLRILQCFLEDQGKVSGSSGNFGLWCFWIWSFWIFENLFDQYYLFEYNTYLI